MEENQLPAGTLPAETTKKGISGGTLKWIAVITMFIDHCTAVFFLTWYWPLRIRAGTSPAITDAARAVYWILRGVGRFAFPIYCFLLVEGFSHTRNVKKYLGRLLLFGLISEAPFDLAFDRVWVTWDSQNVYFTLFLGLLAIWVFDVLRRRAAKEPSLWLRLGHYLLGLLCLGACMYAAHRGGTDYGWGGVLVIFWLYFFRQEEIPRAAAAAPTLLSAGMIEAVSWPDFVLFHFYNGQRGRQPKYFFYVFYPAHLSLLVLVRYLAAGLWTLH